MKKSIVTIILVTLGIGFQLKVSAQQDEIAQLLLNVDKLAQFRKILDDMKKGYDILSGGYNTVKNIAEGNFSVHKVFLDGLLTVSPEVRNYRKVAGVIDYQLRIVKEYRSAMNRFRDSKVLRMEEILYLEHVYSNLFKKSINSLDELTMILTANQLRMSDDERLKAIDQIYQDMADRLSFLKEFNSNTSMLVVQRKKELDNIRSSKKYIGKE
ncbi:TerB family tellurite resistance protein [Sphingobacterium yanglingense]|uniref:TerB family tellurite resistance protein n=1 Tax=Sphingobacterium yanglingense TaxID=1437280 RepID=A0A4R6W519_9SPHI|nr:TerB family tellurite resistance protein [Sphingobacterium yanglingense]TDQ73807.1 hypothetical protein CLV99_4244 [Sphingobacterium yanglingense]